MQLRPGALVNGSGGGKGHVHTRTVAAEPRFSTPADDISEIESDVCLDLWLRNITMRLAMHGP